MTPKFIIVAYNPFGPADSQRYVLTPKGKWAFKYAGVNDHLWSKFDHKEEAEQAAEFVRKSPKLGRMVVNVEAI